LGFDGLPKSIGVVEMLMLWWPTGRMRWGLSPAPGPLGLSPDGSRAYVGLADVPLTTNVEAEMSVINTTSGAIVAAVPLAATPGDIVLDTEGRYTYVSQPSLNSVAVIDSAQNRVVRTIGGFNAPIAIADPREPPIYYLFHDGFDQAD